MSRTASVWRSARSETEPKHTTNILRITLHQRNERQERNDRTKHGKGKKGGKGIRGCTMERKKWGKDEMGEAWKGKGVEGKERIATGRKR